MPLKKAPPRKPKPPRKRPPRDPEAFPLPGSGYWLGCDGMQVGDGTYTVRVLLSGIEDKAAAFKAAKWLSALIEKRLPKDYKIAVGNGKDVRA